MKQKIELDEWVKDILVDPLGKDTLTFTSELAESVYGRNYPIVNNVLDLRMRHPMVTSDQKIWLAGQLHYEKWLATINARNADQDYQKEFEVDQAIYSSFDISG